MSYKCKCLWVHQTAAQLTRQLTCFKLLSACVDFWALYSTGRVPLPVLVKYVAICVRVGRQCHQSGGTDVVDLPDILLPEDQYLDMFDSESDISGDNSEDELVEVL